LPKYINWKTFSIDTETPSLFEIR